MTTSALAGRSLAQVTASLTTGSMAAYTSGWSSAQIAAESSWLKGGAPAALTSLSATAVSAGQVNLNWTDPNTASSETSIRVERATSSSFGSVTSFALSAGATSYSDTTTAGSTTYYYRVFAINAAGDSAASSTAAATTPASSVQPPAAPSNLSASAVSATQINLSWVDNATNETGYRVERSNSSAFTGITAVALPAGSRSYSDTTVIASTTYYYRVFAGNSGGDSSASNTATVTTPAPGPADVYSTNCASCHGSSGQGASAPAVAAAAARTTTTTIVRGGGLTMPSYTTTQISATSLASLATYVSTLGPTPTTGSALYALNCAYCHGATGRGTSKAPYLAGVSASIVNSTTRSGLGTTMPAYNSTDISNTNLNTLASYIATMGPPPTDPWAVYAEYCAMCHGTDGRSGSGGRIAGDSVSSVIDATRSGPDEMPSYTTAQIPDSVLANLAAYVNAMGSTTVTVPPAPTSLTAAAISAAQVNLSWVDNASNETGYRVERATNSSFTGSTSFTLGAGAISYSDTSVAGSTTYYYRVFATNASGNSAASNTASVATPSASSTSTVLAAPSNLATTYVSDVRVSLRWNDNSSDESGFRIERARNSSFSTGLTTFSVGANTTTYSDTSVNSSTTYYYRVYAYNSSGNSTRSNSVVVNTPND